MQVVKICQNKPDVFFIKTAIQISKKSKFITNILPILLICFLLIVNTSTAQQSSSYIDDAKNLVILKKLIEAQPGTFSAQDFDDDIKNQILKQNSSTGFTTTNTDATQGGGVDFGDGFEDGDNQEAQQLKQKLNKFALKELEDEIHQYFDYINFEESYISNNTFKENAKPQQSFKYLKATIQVLKQNQSVGTGTSGIGIGSLLGVSESQILQGITDWALNRAQEELMQAFLREWLEKLQEDELLKEAFPNTLTMLSTSDLASIFTDGETWKATFKQDLDRIPNSIPQLAEHIIQKFNIAIPEHAKTELISGLTAITKLFEDIGKNKKPDEIIFLLGEEAFLNNSTSNYKTIIDRTLVGLNVFLKSIQSVENGVTKYTLPNEILRLSEDELKILWRLIFTREREKIKFSFSLTDENEIAFFKDLDENVQKLKIHLTKASESINSFNALLTKVSELEDKKFTIDQFNSYILLVFELVENGFSNLELLTNSTVDASKIKMYKEKYIEVFQYVSMLHEGIKTKSYGKVALNTLNFVVWMKNYGVSNVKNEFFETPELYKLYDNNMTKDVALEILSIVDRKLNEKLEKFEITNNKMHERLNVLRSKISKDNFVFNIDNIKNVVEEYLNFSEGDLRIILQDLSQEGLLNLESSSEALNKYAKLMASVILAKDSDDIKEALDAVAMKTGGYLFKQHSYFSASITFYPGFEYGWERIEGINELPDTNGTYLGASLPIGLELAAGTNWRPIGAVGVFVQVLDLGAILNYSLSNDSSDVATNPEFGFKQVFSPGAYLTLHLANNPITFGAGFSYSPALREVTGESVTINANAFQTGFFVAVDLNVFALYGSKKKIALKSKSRSKIYEN